MKKRKLQVFIDGWCPVCRRFGRTVKKFDRLDLIVLNDIRTAQTGDAEFKAKAVKSMAAINETGKLYWGFDAVFQVFLRLPLGWLLVPFLFVLKMTKSGEFIYRELALKRSIIPIHCDGECEMGS